MTVLADANRRRHAAWSLIAWYAQVPICAALSFMAVLGDPVWRDILLVYVTVLSVWAGIEAAHARLHAKRLAEDG